MRRAVVTAALIFLVGLLVGLNLSAWQWRELARDLADELVDARAHLVDLEHQLGAAVGEDCAGSDLSPWPRRQVATVGP